MAGSHWLGARKAGTDSTQHQPKDAGTKPTDGRDIVNPLDCNACTEAKIAHLQRLSAENEPLIRDFSAKLDAKLGTESSKPVYKSAADIKLKAERPDIREKKPWFAVEHVRDSIRFRTVTENLDTLPRIVQELKNSQFEVIEPDFSRLLKPKGRGGAW